MPSLTFTVVVPPLSSETAPEVGGEIVPIEDHCADGLTVLFEEYKQSPVLQAMICAYLSEVQVAEDDVASFRFVFDIANASGDVLDLIGRIVTEDRNGLADTDYRRALRTRILTNRSEGLIEDLIAAAVVWSELESGEIQFQDIGPAYIRATLWEDPPTNVPGLFKRLNAARAGGVRIDLIYFPEGDDTFDFSGTYATPEGTTTRGFGSAYNAGTGAGFAGVLS